MKKESCSNLNCDPSENHDPVEFTTLQVTLNVKVKLSKHSYLTLNTDEPVETRDDGEKILIDQLKQHYSELSTYRIWNYDAGIDNYFVLPDASDIEIEYEIEDCS